MYIQSELIVVNGMEHFYTVGGEGGGVGPIGHFQS